MLFEKKVVAAYKNRLFVRQDDTGSVFYYSQADFPGLRLQPYVFRAAQGHKLQGYFYYYPAAQQDRLVVFDHGFGGGHRAYMKEIELLAQHGYRVFAYDHTGCMESEGETPNGLGQSLSDLNACLTALKSDPALAGVKLSVMGHSWGGFAALNISALHPDLTHVIVLSGFVSVERLIEQNFSGALKPYRAAIRRVEEAANPSSLGFDAVESLQKTDAKVLLIYSDDDPMLKKEVHYDYLARGLAGRENVEFMLVSGKLHNPNYTHDAVEYLTRFQGELAKARKGNKLATPEQRTAFRKSYDWARMTEQDEFVWDRMFACLDK